MGWGAESALCCWAAQGNLPDSLSLSFPLGSVEAMMCDRCGCRGRSLHCLPHRHHDSQSPPSLLSSTFVLFSKTLSHLKGLFEDLEPPPLPPWTPPPPLSLWSQGTRGLRTSSGPRVCFGGPALSMSVCLVLARARHREAVCFSSAE